MIIYPDNDFARSTPEAQGIRSQAIEAMLRDIVDTGADIHSMLIMRHGHLVFEHYFAPYDENTPHSMYSCSKTFTSMLIGIARDKGLLRLDDKVLSFFPDREIAAPSDNLRAMTVEDLLMMGSGHAEDTFGPMMSTQDDPEADWVRIFLDLPVTHAPGTHFVYNTGATYMLSAILTRVTGKSALELANEWLFGDMGIEGATWDSCPRGISLGGTGLHIKPRDMLRMGMLLLARGRWKDKQLVSPDYIDRATRKHIENRSGDPNQDPNWASGYCYQIWRCAFDAFRADGMGGQFIVCLPALDMIVVFTSALGNEIPIGYPLTLIERHLLGGTFDKPQVYDTDAAASLGTLCAALRCPKAQTAPAGLAVPYGRPIALDENPAGLTALTLNEASIEIAASGGTVTAPYAWGAPVLSDAPQPTFFSWSRQAVLSGQADGAGGSVGLWLRYLGEPLTVRVLIEPDGDGFRVTVDSTLATTFTVRGKLS